MGTIALYAIIIIVYFCCPVWLEFIIFIVNLLYPDQIPVIDELLMGLAMVKRISDGNI